MWRSAAIGRLQPAGRSRPFPAARDRQLAGIASDRTRRFPYARSLGRTGGLRIRLPSSLPTAVANSTGADGLTSSTSQHRLACRWSPMSGQAAEWPSAKGSCSRQRWRRRCRRPSTVRPRTCPRAGPSIGACVWQRTVGAIPESDDGGGLQYGLLFEATSSPADGQVIYGSILLWICEGAHAQPGTGCFSTIRCLPDGTACRNRT
jgi:hypothetical protein